MQCHSVHVTQQMTVQDPLIACWCRCRYRFAWRQAAESARHGLEGACHTDPAAVALHGPACHGVLCRVCHADRHLDSHRCTPHLLFLLLRHLQMQLQLLKPTCKVSQPCSHLKVQIEPSFTCSEFSLNDQRGLQCTALSSCRVTA